MLETVDQIAARLNVSAPTVWRYVRVDPDFPRPIKLSPGCSRWRGEDVEAWIGRRAAAA